MAGGRAGRAGNRREITIDDRIHVRNVATYVTLYTLLETCDVSLHRRAQQLLTQHVVLLTLQDNVIF